MAAGGEKAISLRDINFELKDYNALSKDVVNRETTESKIETIVPADYPGLCHLFNSTTNCFQGLHSIFDTAATDEQKFEENSGQSFRAILIGNKRHKRYVKTYGYGGSMKLIETKVGGLEDGTACKASTKSGVALVLEVLSKRERLKDGFRGKISPQETHATHIVTDVEFGRRAVFVCENQSKKAVHNIKNFLNVLLTGKSDLNPLDFRIENPRQVKFEFISDMAYENPPQDVETLMRDWRKVRDALMELPTSPIRIKLEPIKPVNNPIKTEEFKTIHFRLGNAIAPEVAPEVNDGRFESALMWLRVVGQDVKLSPDKHTKHLKELRDSITKRSDIPQESREGATTSESTLVKTLREEEHIIKSMEVLSNEAYLLGDNLCDIVSKHSGSLSQPKKLSESINEIITENRRSIYKKILFINSAVVNTEKPVIYRLDLDDVPFMKPSVSKLQRRSTYPERLVAREKKKKETQGENYGEDRGMKKYSLRMPLGKKHHQKVILLLGAAGSGKTTLIKAMINQIFGVRFEDDYRLDIIPPPTNISNSNARPSTETNGIRLYEIHWHEDLNIPFSLTIIDTPGLGSDIDFDCRKAINELQASGLIDKIDVIACVIQAFLPRLTAKMKQLFADFDNIFSSSFSGKLLPQRVILLTFCDSQEAQVLHAVRDIDFQYEKHFEFNNSVLYSPQSQAGDKSYVRELKVSLWGMNENSFRHLWQMMRSKEKQ